MELHITKEPISCNKTDLAYCWLILNDTNVHKSDYDAKQQISGTHSNIGLSSMKFEEKEQSLLMF